MFEAQRYMKKPGIIQMEHPGLRLRPYVTLRFLSVKSIALAIEIHPNVINSFILEVNLFKAVDITHCPQNCNI